MQLHTYIYTHFHNLQKVAFPDFKVKLSDLKTTKTQHQQNILANKKNISIIIYMQEYHAEIGINKGIKKM